MTKLHIQQLAAAAAAVVISMAGGALCAQQYGGEGFYPAGCVDDTSCLPLPGEAPLSYFGRTLNMTRGPYGHYAETQYPEDCSTLAPPGVDISRAPPTHQEQFASFNADPSELSQSYTEDYQDLVPGGDCCGPSSQKPGVFQKWSFQATQIGAGNDNGAKLAQSDLETWVVFGLPCPTRDNPLLITPGYGRHLLSGPNAPDLPSTLHDVYLQFRWMGKVNEFWGYDLVFTPGVYTDFEGGVTGDAWRYTGRAIATYQWAPWTQLVFGVVYLDREDVAALPAFGVIYEPCDGVRWELIAPRPRYARRVY
ncbi:MAG: hypothetical protein KDA41_06780, partial [Planctomycetales bacterium]|nr:hypothetical protein [Planctomycetales bacterium]